MDLPKLPETFDFVHCLSHFLSEKSSNRLVVFVARLQGIPLMWGGEIIVPRRSMRKWKRTNKSSTRSKGRGTSISRSNRCLESFLTEAESEKALIAAESELFAEGKMFLKPSEGVGERSVALRANGSTSASGRSARTSAKLREIAFVIRSTRAIRIDDSQPMIGRKRERGISERRLTERTR